MNHSLTGWTCAAIPLKGLDVQVGSGKHSRLRAAWWAPHQRVKVGARQPVRRQRGKVLDLITILLVLVLIVLVVLCTARTRRLKKIDTIIKLNT